MMFENIPNWAIIFYIVGYVLIIPFGFFVLFYPRVKKNIKIGYLIGILMYIIAIAIVVVMVFSIPLENLENSILQAFKLMFVISTSPFVGGIIYYLWHGIARRGMDKKETK
jgi:hypothetical protein